MCAEGDEEGFYKKIDDLLPRNVTGITYNGRGFDNRVLSIQAMRHRPSFDLRGIARQSLAERFSGVHCDLADHFSGQGASRTVKLAEICHALDIPIKTSVNGSDVAALWRAGKYEAIRNYVREDVVATYIVWLHFIAFQRSNEKLMMLPLAELAAWIENEPGLATLQPFADCRPARLARARAPALRAEAALVNAELRLKREHYDKAFAASPF